MRRTEMQVRIDYTTQEQLDRNVEVFKEHFDVVEISKEYSNSKRNRAYIRYNMK